MKRGNRVFSKKAVRVGRCMARWGASGMNWAICPYRDAVIAASRESLKSLSALDELGRAFLVGDDDAVTMSRASYLILRHCPAGREQIQLLALQGITNEWDAS